MPYRSVITPPPPDTNMLAVVALVGSFFIGPVGVICGAISVAQIRRTGQGGRGVAIAGIVVGAAQTVACLLIAVALTAALASSAAVL